MSDNSINREEVRKAIDKYQKEHPLHFGTVLDVTAISSKESADIISKTIEQISEKVNEDTELWCICEMAKMYMQGVKPVYTVKQHGEWIPISVQEPDVGGIYFVTAKDISSGYIGIDIARRVSENVWFFGGEEISGIEIIAWMPVPKPYKEAEDE